MRGVIFRDINPDDYITAARAAARAVVAEGGDHYEYEFDNGFICTTRRTQRNIIVYKIQDGKHRERSRTK